MPYIRAELRSALDQSIDRLPALGSGDLAYVVYRLMLETARYGGYAEMAQVYGVILSTAAEFYRQVIVPYENSKRMENGDVL